MTGATIVAVVVALIVGSFAGLDYYRRSELVKRAETSMRMANSYVAELLDESARLTKAGYLEKAPRRIQDLDSLVASTLAIDDAALPGLTKATTDYVKGSRNFVNAFTQYVQADIKASVALANHKSHDEFANSSLGRYMLSKSDQQILMESKAALAAVEAEPDVLARTDEVVTMVKHQKLAEMRRQYLDSRAALNADNENSQRALQQLNSAGVELGRIGGKVSELAGKQMPVQAWQVPGT
jgi:hypothetical protein